MIGKIIILTLLGVCSASIFNKVENFIKKPLHGVERFVMNQKDNVLTDVKTGVSELTYKFDNFILQSKPKKIHSYPVGRVEPQKKLKLGTFNIANCSSPSPDKAIFVVKALSVLPDPATIPGSLQISFVIEILQDISTTSAEIDVVMNLTRGSSTVQIPCIGELFGSCNYPNVCDLLEQVVSCPPEFEAANIPCKCPFKKGSYVLKALSVEIDAEVLVSGDYFVHALMKSNGLFAACYDVHFTIIS